MVFFSYIGFDSVSTLAAEVKNPTRDMPLGIVGTLVITTVMYIGVSFVVNGMVPFWRVDRSAPIAAAFSTRGVTWAAILVSVGSMTSLTATTLVSLLGQPRIFYQMARDVKYVSLCFILQNLKSTNALLFRGSFSHNLLI
jgi:APA family basic amino acid/polyamine antiporter